MESLAAQCRFANCQHESEPGCVVLAALAAGRLDQARFDSYQRLQRELAHLATELDRRAQLDAKSQVRRVTRDYNRTYKR